LGNAEEQHQSECDKQVLHSGISRGDAQNLLCSLPRRRARSMCSVDRRPTAKRCGGHRALG
jgi:hypothetical protein